jgi:thiol-disulfide isomerase/thioredoxin
MRRATIPFLLLAVLTACTHAVSDTSGSGVVAQNKPFPRLTGQTLTGADLDTNSLLGKPFVLSVWATWCAPCAREQPMLHRLQQKFGDGVGFLGIDYRDDSAAAKAWTQQFTVTYPSLSDPSGRFAKDLGFPFLPDTYVVDSTGTIRYAFFGEPDEQQLSSLITGLLPSGSAPASPTSG